VLSAAFILLGSKVADLIGRKRAYVLGLLGYAVGATAMTLAQGLTAIIVFWAIIGGLGASLLLPSMQSLVHGNFYCPEALAGIGELPDTVADRSIPIRMRRPRPGESVKRFRMRDVREAHATEPLARRRRHFAGLPRRSACAQCLSHGSFGHPSS